jgi:Zn finger protein HypA/HybF involved in hydrogenase expression
MTRCQRCGSAIDLNAAITICPPCGTEYYPGQPPD